jgi:transposase
MLWKASSVVEERLRFVGRLLDGEAMSNVCREFGISRKTGYKVYSRYKKHGWFALTDRLRWLVRYANQLPQQVESLIVNLKRDKPHWGRAKFASCWSGGLTATSECRRRARFMPCSAATAWSVA